MRILSIFILTIHATKDIEAHHKPGYSKYVADDESKVKVRNSDNQNMNVSEANIGSQTWITWDHQLFDDVCFTGARRSSFSYLGPSLKLSLFGAPLNRWTIIPFVN